MIEEDQKPVWLLTCFTLLRPFTKSRAKCLSFLISPLSRYTRYTQMPSAPTRTTTAKNKGRYFPITLAKESKETKSLAKDKKMRFSVKNTSRIIEVNNSKSTVRSNITVPNNFPIGRRSVLFKTPHL